MLVFKSSIKKALEEFLKVMEYPTFKSQLILDLSDIIEEYKIEGIINKKLEIESLSRDEAIAFLRWVYNFTKEEKFNPSEIFVTKNPNQTTVEYYSKQDLYNSQFKKEFLSTYSKETQRVTRVLFGKTSILEHGYNKDLYDFSKDELESLLKSLKATTLRSLQNLISKIEQYIDFAIKHKKTKDKINYAILFDSKGKVNHLLNAEAQENSTFNKKDIFYMAHNSENPQDGVILGLIFDGVNYKNEFEELINLTIDRCNLDGLKINFPNRDEALDISDETRTLIKEAFEQKKYRSINGEVIRNYTLASDNKHVIRGLRGKAKVKGQIISQRILRVAEFWTEPFLKATTISYSGQLHYAEKLLSQGADGEEVVERVIEKFNISDNYSARFSVKTRIESHINSLTDQ